MTTKYGIDTGALIEQFAQMSAKQADAARQAAREAVLKSLQGRELSIKAIKDALGVVTKAASAGTGQSLAGVEADAVLAKVVAGMDDAVRQAVQASHRALQQFVEQGVDLREKQFKKAVVDIEKMEEAFFDAVRKSASGAAAQPLAQSWARSLSALQKEGSATGGATASALEQLSQAATQAQQAAREGRELSQSVAQLTFDHYAALAAGVLLGMSGAMGAPLDKPAAASARKRR